MADDQDKSQQTEEPTAKRLEQAREHGDVVKSTEVTTFVLLGGRHASLSPCSANIPSWDWRAF